MIEQLFINAWKTSAAALAAVSLAAALLQWRLGVGIASGGLWNLASLWCLARMFAAWLGTPPSRKRAVVWLLLKLVVLYPAAWFLLQTSFSTPLTFGIGFTLVLILTLATFAVKARRLTLGGSRVH